jgi:excisionase family DNA binding protein
MTSRRPIGGKDPPVNADSEDDLTRLIRTIARQAAREAFNLVRDAFETPLAPAGSPCGPPELENRPDNTATKTNASPEPGERFLSVAEVAVRLDVSPKTVRRMIDRGDLRAHRIGRLVRVGEGSLAGCLGKASQ